MRFQGKTALVTGGTKGIGLGVAQRLASEGANVVITGRNADTADEAMAAIPTAGGEVRFAQGDVAIAADAERMVAETVNHFGRLDIGVNNAGIGGRMVRIHEMQEDYWDQVIDIDLKGVWLSMKFEIAAMLNSGGGSIINMSSMAGIKGAPVAGSAYAAAKHGVVGLTTTGALEYAADGIRINCLCPAVIETPLAAESFADPELRAFVEAKHPIGRVGIPEDVAAAVAYLAADEASFMTGTVIPVAGGFGL